MDYALSIIFAIYVATVVIANISYWQDRQALTPEERKRFDEEIDKEMQIW
jgi:hypothetical protein